MEKLYFCIDLKTFYASVECVERNLNPFLVGLVVADSSRGNGSICLAISPYLKSLGIQNRCRIYEIPNTIPYIIAKPRMKKYMEYSKNIYKIYLKYFSKEDIFVYSIDECFIDVTGYIKLYEKNKNELAKMVIDDVFKQTGICATVGIGTNLFLAKVALDITAKHSKDNMGFLDIEKFKKTIWYHTPITDIWNIGKGIAKRLEKYNAYSLYAVSRLNKEVLYKEFGVNAKFLIDHSKGIEPCTIEDIHNYIPKNKSISNQQILYAPYDYENGYLVLKEMVEVNTLNLVSKGLVTNCIYIRIGYEKRYLKATGGSMSLNEYTNSYKALVKYFSLLYERTTIKSENIKKIGIGFKNLVIDKYKTINLFSDISDIEKELNLQKAILKVKNKYGKNSIFKGMNLENKATTLKRNKLIGGHNAEG